MLYLIMFHALYGLSLPISKLLLGYTTPFFLTGIRMLGGGIIVCVPLALWLRSFAFFKKNLLGTYCKVALFMVYLKYVFRYISLSYLSVAKLSFIMACSPFVAALFSYIWYQERLTKKQWLSLFIGFFGLFPLLFISGKGEFGLYQCLLISWPEVAAFCSIMAHVYGMVLVRNALRSAQTTPLALNGITACIGGVLALLTAIFIEPFPSVTTFVGISGGVSVLIVLSNVICHTFYMHLLSRYTVTFITFTDFLSAFFSSFYGWFFLHEPFSWHYIVSAIIIVIALLLFYQQELKAITIKE